MMPNVQVPVVSPNLPLMLITLCECPECPEPRGIVTGTGHRLCPVCEERQIGKE